MINKHIIDRQILKKSKVVVSIIIFLFGLISLFVFKQQMQQGISSGLILCSTVIIPALFPSMALSAFFAKTNALRAIGRRCSGISKVIFKLPGIAVPIFLLSLVSGYPVGAQLTKMLYTNGDITLNQGKKMTLFCFGAGPAFLVLAVGCGMMKSERAGLLLFISHVAASLIMAIICGALIKTKQSDLKVTAKGLAASDAFVEGLASASAAIISICAYTVLFSSVMSVISEINNIPFVCTAASLIEVSNGCAYVSVYSGSLPVLAAVTGFGGLSVILQVATAAGKTRPSMKKLLLVRAGHSVLSFIICTVLVVFFPFSQKAFSPLNTAVPKLSNISVQFSIAMLILCVVFLFSTYQMSNKRLLDFF